MKWLPHEDRTLIDMREGGATFAEIAKHLPGRTVIAVDDRAARLGLANPRGRPSGSGVKALTPEQQAQVLDLYAQGIGSGAAARILNVPRHRIRRFLDERGITKMTTWQKRGVAEERVRPRRGLTERKCLCCRQAFMSSWIGNRMCQPCKERGYSMVEA